MNFCELSFAHVNLEVLSFANVKLVRAEHCKCRFLRELSIANVNFMRAEHCESEFYKNRAECCECEFLRAEH